MRKPEHVSNRSHFPGKAATLARGSRSRPAPESPFTIVEERRPIPLIQTPRSILMKRIC
jgi:hypothetical protein